MKTIPKSNKASNGIKKLKDKQQIKQKPHPLENGTPEEILFFYTVPDNELFHMPHLQRLKVSATKLIFYQNAIKFSPENFDMQYKLQEAQFLFDVCKQEVREFDEKLLKAWWNASHPEDIK